jgi:uncharacterized membrane protein YfcA
MVDLVSPVLLAVAVTPLQQVLSVISGLVVGFSLGLIGGGGSILAVPLLLYFVGLDDPHIVIGTTALAVSANAYLNLIPHGRSGNVKWKDGIAFAVIGSIAAFVGSSLGKAVDGKKLLFLFALLMIAVAVMMLKRGRTDARKRNEVALTGSTSVLVAEKTTTRYIKIAIAASIVGLLSGFFGIGGGFLIVPGLIFATGMPMLAAVGTSLVSVGTFGLTTAINYARSGLVDWLVAALYIAGGILGGWFGSRLATKLGKQSKGALNLIFALLVIVVAIYMLYKNLAAFHIHL